MTTGPAWKKEFISCKGAAASTQSAFSITLPAGQMVEVWGLQVEAQPYSSVYKQTCMPEGIFENTWFGDDELKITNTSMGLSSCEIRLISRI